VKRQYVASFRAIYTAEDDVEAELIADKIEENARADLVIDDEADYEPSFACTQLVNNVLDISPQEVVTILRKARNLLIRSRRRSALDVARMIDIEAFAVEQRREPGMETVGYDYGRFLDVCETILKEKSAGVE
jgi:hypothetical protein